MRTMPRWESIKQLRSSFYVMARISIRIEHDLVSKSVSSKDNEFSSFAPNLTAWKSECKNLAHRKVSSLNMTKYLFGRTEDLFIPRD